MRVLIFSTHFVWNFFRLKGIQQDIIINVHKSSCKVPVSFVGFEWNLNFVDRFPTSTQLPDFMKIRLVEAEFSHAERQTDRQTEIAYLLASFRNFSKAPKI